MKKSMFLLPVLLSVRICFAQDFSCKDRKQHHPSSIEQRSDKAVITADSARSDTNDILKTTINLQITDFTNKIISGNSKIDFVPKVNGIHTISFDLLKLIVDSVVQNNSNLSFAYNDTLLIVSLPSTLNSGDTSSVTVYYHGTPQVDPQWGGFYFQGGEAYNLGVGFAANPHVYGRVWFPCFDNFVERCKFEFNIRTNGGKVAFCNGLLTKDTTDAGGLRTRTWVLNEAIPSYLAGISVGNYTQVNQSFVSMTGDTIPVVLSDIASDTTKLKNSFVHLKDAFASYEFAFGPNRWPKVGYMIVQNGAMEHPTAISYPRFLINGTTQNEDIMAHELSHHWWGDLVTCHREEEMWINEGMATFAQYYFYEWVYGITSYKNQIRANHENLIHYLHYKEGGYLALSEIPHSITYGEHVYNKGGDVSHTMRGYLGDSLFFAGLRHVLATHQFTDLSSLQFRDAMTAGTGVNMNDFFSGWIFNGGWPQFSIDSFSTVVNLPGFDVTVHVRQKLDGAPAYFNNVPLEITFRDAQWNTVTKKINVSGPTTSSTVSIPISPAFAGVDMNERISDAITSDTRTITSPGTFFSSVANGRMQVTVQAISPNDSALLFVEHNWAPPDSFKTPNPLFKLSPYHYWKVSGMFPPLFDAAGMITYDGRTIMSSGNGYLDHQLLTGTNQEDSIVLMYRKDAAAEWSPFPYYTKNMNNLTDRFGIIKIDSLLQGEYTIGFSYAPANSVLALESFSGITVFPNPTTGRIEIRSLKSEVCRIDVCNVYGAVVHSSDKPFTFSAFDLSSFPSGIYFLQIKTSGGTTAKKIVKQ